jgi:hypothetical protein
LKFTGVSEVLVASIIREMIEAASSSEKSANLPYYTAQQPRRSHLHTRRRENIKHIVVIVVCDGFICGGSGWLCFVWKVDWSGVWICLRLLVGCDGVGSGYTCGSCYFVCGGDNAGSGVRGCCSDGGCFCSFGDWCWYLQAELVMVVLVILVVDIVVVMVAMFGSGYGGCCGVLSYGGGAIGSCCCHNCSRGDACSCGYCFW